MTYAAQVRSISKSVSSQPVEDNFYDFNSLRIICKYFVGSIITLKTSDEIIEGVLHTIYNNKICMTFVTISKSNAPEMIIETAASKSINLGDVLYIASNGSDKQEVFVKGKYFKVGSEIKDKSIKPHPKSMVKATSNGKPCNQKPTTTVESVIIEDVKEPLSTNEVDKPLENQVEEPVKIQSNGDLKEPKKSFSFNPNAPEFKPRTNITYPENVNGHILYPQHGQQFPPVFTPNSAPAIFVPNIFFYASSNQSMNNMENCSFDNINIEPPAEVPIKKSVHVDDQYVRKSMSDMHITSPALPFPQMMPLFPPPLPIFVPNHSFKFNALPFSNVEIPNGSDLSNKSDVVDSPESVDNNELSDPLNWPPLPVPGNQMAQNPEYQK